MNYRLKRHISKISFLDFYFEKQGFLNISLNIIVFIKTIIIENLNNNFKISLI